MFATSETQGWAGAWKRFARPAFSCSRGTVSTGAACLRRGEHGALTLVEIGSRSLEVLRVLLERPGELLSRHEIMAA